MNKIKEFDSILVLLQKQAAAIHYNIDEDSRYKEVTRLATLQDFGELEMDYKTNSQIYHQLSEIEKCLLPDYELIKSLMINS